MGEATYSPALQIGVPDAVRSSKEGHSYCGCCCDMVSSPQYLVYLPVLVTDEAAGSCKNGRILSMHDQILTQLLVFQRRATIIVNI